jgi:S-DNA-T family DNA segregation ATPase FtsK/SpoIIIE
LTTWAGHRREEIQGLLLFSASALVMSGVGQPEGEVGKLAVVLTDMLGIGVAYPPMVLALWGLRKFRHRQAFRDRSEFLAWSLNLPILLGILEIVHHGTGGTVGFWASAYLRVLAGPSGALILFLTGGVITVCHCLALSPRQLLRRLDRLGKQFLVTPVVRLGQGILWALSGFQRVIYLAITDLWIIINLLSKQLSQESEGEVGGGEPITAEEFAAVPGPRRTPLPQRPAIVRGQEKAKNGSVPDLKRENWKLSSDTPWPHPEAPWRSMEDPLHSPRAARAASLRRYNILPPTPPPNADFPMFQADFVAGEAYNTEVSLPVVEVGEPRNTPSALVIRARRMLPADTHEVRLVDAPVVREAPVARTSPPAPSQAASSPEEVLPVLEVARPQEHLPSPSELLAEVRAEEKKKKRIPEPYVYPSLDLFNSPPENLATESDEELARKAELITVTLGHFGISSEITRVTCGPTITQFELKPAAGVKISKITSLTDDLAMALAVASVRIEAPIPGRGAVGIEVPNKTSVPVFFQEMAAQRPFRSSKAPLSYVMGKGISGEPVVADLHKAPHMLVAGATGAGKSVCMNAIISSMLMRNSPEDLKMILIDPKMVEMMIYDGIAHLITPVITDPKAASAALQWAVLEMERRYKLLSKAGYRNIEGFNKAVKSGKVTSVDVGGPPEDARFGPLPYMVIVIDELADLMMVAAKDIEDSICRIAQMARAVGMHLIVATQRPSTNVITGIIKANLPTRVAFRVASRVDSKVILDHTGAEALLGKGDMLFMPVGQPKPVRIQGALIEEDEIKRLVAHIKEHCEPDYEDIVAVMQDEDLAAKAELANVEDEYLGPCIRFAIEQGEVSTSLLQRHFKIGYNRAACIVDVMEARGVVSGPENGRRRKVLANGGDLERIMSSLATG